MRLVGTGKDPRGQFPDGQAFDVPAGESEYADQLVKDGFAVKPSDKDYPGDVSQHVRKLEVAQGIVRGDALNAPVDRAHTDEFSTGPGKEGKRDAHGTVHSDAPVKHDGQPDQPEGVEAHSQDEARGETPERQARRSRQAAKRRASSSKRSGSSSSSSAAKKTSSGSSRSDSKSEGSSS